MTVEEKLKVLKQFEDASNAFDDVLTMSEELILFRPFEDAWSIKEQIVHCMDVDIANFHRYRKAIAQPEAQIISFTGVWTSALNYQSADLASAIELIKNVRKFMIAHLKTIVNHDWKKYAYMHDEKGRVNLEEALIDYAAHAEFHRKLIDRNVELFMCK
jgi:hypothetical protein